VSIRFGSVEIIYTFVVMEKKKYEIKKVKLHEDMSEETPCFSAQLFVEGVYVADVSNSGHGGGNRFRAVNGFSYKDYAHLDNLDDEADIFGLVYEWGDVGRLQRDKIDLKKDGNLYTIQMSAGIGKMKKTPQGITMLKRIALREEAKGYKVMNRNF